MSLNSQHFDFSGCCFSKKNMGSIGRRDGLSKVRLTPNAECFSSLPRSALVLVVLLLPLTLSLPEQVWLWPRGHLDAHQDRALLHARG